LKGCNTLETLRAVPPGGICVRNSGRSHLQYSVRHGVHASSSRHFAHEAGTFPG
jgi:hypothetical protein